MQGTPAVKLQPAPRVGVIGLGHWGANLVRNMSALGALAMVNDSAASARAKFAASYPAAEVAESAEALLANPGVEAVMIATPAATHGALVKRALAAGKHVFVEKPLCLDVAEAKSLKAEAERRGRVLMVGHLLHYHPAFIALRDAVHAGALGPLRYVYSHRLSLGRIRREENALWSFAPHDISMILALVGAMPQRVSAEGAHFLSEGVADTTLSHLTFPRGEQAHLFVSWLHPFKDQRIVVVGEKAMAVFNDVAPGPEKLLLYRHAAGWSGDIPVVTRAEAEPIPYGVEEPLRRECEAFLAAVRGGPPPPSDAAEGIRVLTVLDACQRALEGRMPVTLAAAW
jgi:UDP-2-acetamido-3-amino-2,3-dideoxy-glucuronate N-acetyltransferase